MSTKPQPTKPPHKNPAAKPQQQQKKKGAKNTATKQPPAKTPAAKPKRHVGRSKGDGSKYTPELASEILERLSAGTPMAEICRSPHMPSVETVWRWEQADTSFAQSIAHARRDGYDAIAVEGLRIVDDLTEDPASRRVRSDYRLKLLAKWDPKRYGERLDQFIEIEAGPKLLESTRERAMAIVSMLDRNRPSSEQLIELDGADS